MINNFYVDDVLTGANSLDDAKKLKNDLIQLLSLGGFELRKFHSNIKSLSSKEEENNLATILGFKWDTISDNFHISYNIQKIHNVLSKRNVLSEIAQIFDPLGFCAPVTFKAKLFMQQLWSNKELGLLSVTI